MRLPPNRGRKRRRLTAANDNQAGRYRARVEIPADLPLTQVEIEVIAFLLDDWGSLAANDNEEQSQ